MRKVTLVFLALLTVAGAIGTLPPTEAAGGGPSPGCSWSCNCAGTPICTCVSGSGSCGAPIGCPQIYTC